MFPNLKSFLCLCVVVILSVSFFSVNGTANSDLTPNGIPKMSPCHATSNDTASHGSSRTAGTFDKTISSGGAMREYELYVPSGVSSATGPVPLMIYLHGAGGDRTQGKTVWKSSADSNTFIVASPTGDYSQSWRELYFPDTYKYYDTLLMSKIANETMMTYNIDLSRIWLSGFSDGASTDIRIAVLQSDRYSVACPHSSSWGTPGWAEPSWAVRKIPIYVRVGDADSFHTSDEQAQTAFTSAGFEFQLDLITGFGHNWHSASCGLFVNFEKARPLQHNWIRPALAFNSPGPAETVTGGLMYNLEWWLGCGNPPYDITLEYSTTGSGGPWMTVTTLNQPAYGAGMQGWNVPNVATTNAVLRATITDSSSPVKTNVSVMNYTFEIVPGAVPDGSVLLLMGSSVAMCSIAVLVLKRKRMM